MQATVFRMMELVHEGFYCSQVLVQLGLEAQGKRNPDLVRAAGGLALGTGAGEGTCGTLTGAACLLSLYGGKGRPDEEEHEVLRSMLLELWRWFETRFGEAFGGITCSRILEDGADRRRRCGPIVAETYEKAVEILTDHGFDLSRGRDG